MIKYICDHCEQWCEECMKKIIPGFDKYRSSISKPDKSFEEVLREFIQDCLPQ